MKRVFNSDGTRVYSGAPGGGHFAKTKGKNRKAEQKYDARAVDFDRMIATSKTPNAYTKPGSRKKVH